MKFYLGYCRFTKLIKTIVAERCFMYKSFSRKPKSNFGHHFLISKILCCLENCTILLFSKNTCRFLQVIIKKLEHFKKQNLLSNSFYSKYIANFAKFPNGHNYSCYFFALNSDSLKLLHIALKKA